MEFDERPRPLKPIEHTYCTLHQPTRSQSRYSSWFFHTIQFSLLFVSSPEGKTELVLHQVERLLFEKQKQIQLDGDLSAAALFYYYYFSWLTDWLNRLCVGLTSAFSILLRFVSRVRLFVCFVARPFLRLEQIIYFSCSQRQRWCQLWSQSDWEIIHRSSLSLFPFSFFLLFLLLKLFLESEGFSESKLREGELLTHSCYSFVCLSVGRCCSCCSCCAHESSAVPFVCHVWSRRGLDVYTPTFVSVCLLLLMLLLLLHSGRRRQKKRTNQNKTPARIDWLDNFCVFYIFVSLRLGALQLLLPPFFCCCFLALLLLPPPPPTADNMM